MDDVLNINGVIYVRKNIEPTMTPRLEKILIIAKDKAKINKKTYYGVDEVMEAIINDKLE